MGLEKLWRLDKPWFWVISFFIFLAVELGLRIKLGVIFWLAAAWFAVLEWQAKRLLGMEFSSNQILKILKSFYYALLVSVLIFAVFFLLNAVCRSFDNSIIFFQLP
jgi:hypothetical protein